MAIILSEDHLTECRKTVFAFITLIIIILSTYSNTYHASWQFDDTRFRNREAIHLNKLNWSQIQNTFFRDNGTVYRPVAWLSLAVNYYFNKDDVYGYHVVNIIIHIFASLFLFLFIYHLLHLPLLKTTYGQNAYAIALLATILWAINPVQTQAVTYIIQRMASMAAMFYIMSMYFYLKARTSKRLSSQTTYFIGCFLCGFMAFGSKENSAMLPIIILLFEIWFIQEFDKRVIKRSLWILLILIAFLMLYGFITRSSSTLFDLNYLVQKYSERSFTLWERLLTEPRVIIFYITLLFYPMPNRLCIAHDISLSQGFLNPSTTLLSILLVLSAIIFAMVKAKKWPLFSFCIIFFFINHSIESSFIPLELIFEHRNYLPSMLFFIPISILFFKLLELFYQKPLIKGFIIFFIIALIVGQGHSTFIRNAIWKTSKSLWMDATEKAPDIWRPWHNLGKYYSSANMPDKALSYYLMALSKRCAVSPYDKHLTFYNIGTDFQNMGNIDMALLYYRKAEKLFPFGPHINNKGALLAEKGEIKEAINEFNKAIKYSDNNKRKAMAYSNLGFLLLKQGHRNMAIQNLKIALRLDPHNPPTLLRLGYALKNNRQYGKAFLLYKKYQNIRPKDLKILLYLAEIYKEKGMETQLKSVMEQFLSKARESDLLTLTRELEEKKPDYIKIDTPIILNLLSMAYSKKMFLITSLEKYIDKDTY